MGRDLRDSTWLTALHSNTKQTCRKFYSFKELQVEFRLGSVTENTIRRLAVGETVNKLAGHTTEEVVEFIEEKELRANTQMLEIIGTVKKRIYCFETSRTSD